MKKIILIILVAAIGCKGNVDKANDSLDRLLIEQNIIDSLKWIDEYNTAEVKAIEDSKKGVKVYDGLPPIDIWYSDDYVAYLKTQGDSVSATRIKTLGYHQTLTLAYKNIFKTEISKMPDNPEKLELIKKFDRIYILKTEK